MYFQMKLQIYLQLSLEEELVSLYGCQKTPVVLHRCTYFKMNLQIFSSGKRINEINEQDYTIVKVAERIPCEGEISAPNS